MNRIKIQNFNILGIIGSILMIISEFIVWFPSVSLFEWYFVTINVAIENAFLYLFPLMSGIICLSGNILIIFEEDFRTKFAILNIVGLSFTLIFLLQIIQIHSIIYLIKYIGIYIFIAGLILIIINLIDKLII